MEEGYLIKNEHVVVYDSILIRGEKAMKAETDLPKNTIIFLYRAHVTDRRTRTSIQVAPDKHIEPGDFGAFANHSCSPNTQIIANYDTKTDCAEVLMITIEPVAKGDELTFDYATTETDVTPELSRKKCLCKSERCRQIITGFKDLSIQDKQTLLLSGLTAYYMQID